MVPALEQELVNRTTNLLSILSKKDALAIFLLAKDGLRAETDTPQKIGLTRKQYYTRLKQLADSGLIDKSGDIYTHTTLGTFVHQKHILELLEHVRNVKQMKMVDTLKHTRQFSEDEIANFVGKIAGSSITTSTVPQIRFAATYEDMVSHVIELVQFAKNEILFASRFQNDLIINNIIIKAKAGVKVRTMSDTNLIRNYIKNAGKKLQVTDKHEMERLVAGDPWYPKDVNIDRKLMNVPYSLLIVDGKGAGIEIVDKFESEQFKNALFVKDEAFAEGMKKVFDTWWARADEVNLLKLVEEMATLKSDFLYNNSK
jgi:phosphatidylserine/phosphatidylglycerophosphate/cardiolipin synthase-like enzyme